MPRERSSGATSDRRRVVLVTLAAITAAVLLIVFVSIIGIDGLLMSHRPA